MGERKDNRARVRALGNAERLRVLAYLRNAGEASVGDVAKALSIAPGSASYHIGRLVDGGLARRAEHPGGDGRKSWWQAVDTQDEVEAREDALFFWEANRAYGDAYDRYLQAKEGLPDPWVDAEAGADAVLSLTVEEAMQLKGELEDLVRRWADRHGQAEQGGTSRSEGSEEPAGKREAVALVVRSFRWVP